MQHFTPEVCSISVKTAVSYGIFMPPGSGWGIGGDRPIQNRTLHDRNWVIKIS